MAFWLNKNERGWLGPQTNAMICPIHAMICPYCWITHWSFRSNQTIRNAVRVHRSCRWLLLGAMGSSGDEGWRVWCDGHLALDEFLSYFLRKHQEIPALKWRWTWRSWRNPSMNIKKSQLELTTKGSVHRWPIQGTATHGAPPEIQKAPGSL